LYYKRIVRKYGTRGESMLDFGEEKKHDKIEEMDVIVPTEEE
jgi:hypothetical protein